MRKLFSLLAMLLASFSIPTWADSVMPFEAANSINDADAQMYYIYQPGNERYVKVSGSNILGNGFSGDQFIFVTSSSPDLYYIYDKSCGKYITYTQTTDPNKSVTNSSESAVQLVSSQSEAKTWRFVKEGSTSNYDIFPGEAASYAANSGTASWNFRGGANNALNLYAASDSKSSWQIVAQLSARLNCATRLFAEPGAPFMHKLVGNTKDDVKSVSNLPNGFTLNEDRPDYKYITGTAPSTNGDITYTLNLSDGTTETVTLTVSNKLTQPRPFMGVLTWNAFQNHIDENVIIKLAEGFEKFGLKDAGYNYMCIDDQWAQRNRDASGHLQWNTTKFPNYSTLADRIHQMGLKIGIYSDAGTATCSGAQPGSFEYETADATDFVNWGFDLLKYDYCNVGGATSAAAAEQRYTAMGEALKTAASAKNKDFLFYMCEWGYRSPWLWGANTGATCWRATDDTRDYWSHPNGGVLQVLNKMKGIWAFQGVNRWNDADMMCIGLHGSGYSSNNNSALGYGDGDSRCTGLTMAEQRSQMALWCMFASPLTHSNNITNLDGKPNTLTGKSVTNKYFREDLDIILNKELIALDQDPLGQAGEPIYDGSDYIVFQKDMADGSIGLSITNLTGADKSITVDFGSLTALKSDETYKMRNLWTHEYENRNLNKNYQLTVNVPSHDTFVYRIQKASDPDLTWEEPVIPGLEGIENPEPEPEPELLIDVTKKYRVYNYSRNNANYAWTDQGTEAKTYPLDESRADQVWQFEATGNADYPYYIKSVSTGKYMKAIGAGGGNVQLIDGTSAAGMYNATLKADNNQLYCFNSGPNTGNYLFTDTNNRLDGWKDGNFEYFYVVAIEEAETPAEDEWVTEFPKMSTDDGDATLYYIRNLGAAEGNQSGNDVYLLIDTDENGDLVGKYVSTREEASQFIFSEDENGGIYIMEMDSQAYVSYSSNVEGQVNWNNGGSITRNPIVFIPPFGETEAPKTWKIVADESIADRYDILPNEATANYGWSFMGGVDREWVRLNLESKTNRNAKWVFERQGNNTEQPETPAEVTITEVAGLKVASALADGQFASNTVWYTLANMQSNQTGYISTKYTNGNFLATTNTTKDEDATGQWCIIGNANDGYRFYNRAAGPTKVLSNNANSGSGMVDAATTDNTVFQFNERTAGGKIWNILDFGTTNNCWCGSNNKLGHWAANAALTDNNCRFVFEEVVVEVDTELPLADVAGLKVAPSLLDNGQFASNTVWYTLANMQSNQTGYISTKYTNSTFLATTNTTKDEDATGQWCIIGNANDGYRFYNRAAGPTKVLSNASTSGMVDASATTGTYFEFAERTAGGKIWNIKDFGTATNYWCGSNNKLAHWDSASAASDNNCRWIFETVTTEPTPVEPVDIFSTADEPVFWGLKFNKGGVYVSDKGLDNLAETTSNFVTGWALIGNADGFKLLDTKGNYMGVKTAVPNDGNKNAGPFCYATNDASAETFKLLNDNGTTFEIARASAPGTSFNPWGGQKSGINIGFWTAGSDDNKLVRVDIENMEYFVASEGALAFNKPSKHTLWYNEPAPTDYNGWQEYSLPIGNGEFGGSIFGAVGTDKITFNEKSLWDGASTTRGNPNHGEYLKFGSIWVTDHSAGIADGVTDYVRYLDIDNAVAGVEYTGANNVKYTRTFIASQPAKALIGQYTAAGDAKLDLTFSVVPGGQLVTRSANYKTPTVTYHEDGSATFDGKVELLSYAAQFTVKGDEGAVIEATEGGIRISNTSNVMLYVAGATDFDAFKQNANFVNGRAAQLPADVNGIIEAAATKDFDALRAEATAEYRSWMDRVSLDLKKDGQEANSTMTTKALVDAYTHGGSNGFRNTAEGLFLEQLYYNYGRYLLISSNRYAPVPNNLQGLWVDTDSNHAPWNSDVHTNINIQMNYWPAEQNNLSELHMPLLNHIISIADSPGAKAQALAKNSESAIRQNADVTDPSLGWVINTESNIFGGMSSFANNYTIANAWYCTHLWQHYRYTLDRDFLKKAFPAMWGAAQYWVQRLLKAEDNTFECYNEWSPEHGPNENATAHSQQLVRELFDNVLAAVDVLGAESGAEEAWLNKIRDRRANLDLGLHIETYEASSGWGESYLKYGQPILKEWKYSAFTRGANGHRHTSHLMALYPLAQVSYYSDQTTDEGKANYDFAVAARNSLAQRSDASTGWAMGWRVNLWARTLDGNHARTMINNALAHAGSGVNYSSGGIYYNLWDAHTPFQIDGNFGVCAGISEMLIQSYDETIHLLPALPEAWADGSINGLKAVGNFTVDQTWAAGKLTEATVTSNKGGELRVQYKDQLLTMPTYAGETYTFYFNGDEFACYLADATIVNVTERVKAAIDGNGTFDDIKAAANAVLGISNRK